MKKILRNTLKSITGAVGLDPGKLKKKKKPKLPNDLDKFNANIFEQVSQFTMTSPERINALVDAVKYVSLKGIEGAFVECGVWRGGSAMAAALTFQRLEDFRDFFLYDTFEGMSAPTELDVSIHGNAASERFDELKIDENSSAWCASPLDEVKRNFSDTGYPIDLVHFIKGKVEDTIPAEIPQQISVLRLDTDWYESTKHELTHLFPRLSKDGVLIIDDYGHWQGAKQAVDEYLSSNNIQLLLNRVDYTGRMAVNS